MTRMNLTCEQFDELLSSYFEGTSEPAIRSAMDSHRVACLRCAALVRDIERIRVDAEALPVLAPSRDLWVGISARIDEEVVAAPVFGAAKGRAVRSEPATKPARVAPFLKWGVAAAILMAATSGVTYYATMARVQRAAIGTVAVTQEQADSVATLVPISPSATPIVDPATQGPGPITGGTPAVIPASTRATRVAADVTYDREIAALREVLNQRRLELDPSTVSVIQRSLTTIDIAIQQARTALVSDPASPFLKEQLDKALEKKLGLLRRVALLSTRA